MHIERFHNPSSRYDYDKKYSYAAGFAQVDTRQDCGFFGNWVSPTSRQWVSYAEGDVTIVTCDTDEEFKSYIDKSLAWYDAHDGKPAKIDCMLDAPADRKIRAELERLGFADRLH